MFAEKNGWEKLGMVCVSTNTNKKENYWVVYSYTIKSAGSFFPVKFLLLRVIFYDHQILNFLYSLLFFYFLGPHKRRGYPRALPTDPWRIRSHVIYLWNLGIPSHPGLNPYQEACDLINGRKDLLFRQFHQLAAIIMIATVSCQS